MRAAAAATALRVVFESHLAKENDLVLPLLVSAPDVSVARPARRDARAARRTRLTRATAGRGRRTGCGGHTCTCGEVDDQGFPELDARAVPHKIRHATVFGALAVVAPGGGMVLVAPHDPLPLLSQLEQRSPGEFEVSYLERGPEAWRLQLVRRTAS